MPFNILTYLGASVSCHITHSASLQKDIPPWTDEVGVVSIRSVVVRKKAGLLRRYTEAASTSSER